jgi:hypothetical protein
MTPEIKTALAAHKPALLARLARVESPHPVHAMAGPPPILPTRPLQPTDDTGIRSTAASAGQLARDYAPREPRAFRKYQLRIKSPLWLDDAVADDYRLAARLSMLHARGARAYVREWNDQDQALADRIILRRTQAS